MKHTICWDGIYLYLQVLEGTFEVWSWFSIFHPPHQMICKILNSLCLQASVPFLKNVDAYITNKEKNIT